MQQPSSSSSSPPASVIKLVKNSRQNYIKFLCYRNMHMKEVSVGERQQKKSSICSLPVRIVCEIFCVLLVFVPLLLFVFAWPNAKTVIHGKVLSVSAFGINK